MSDYGLKENQMFCLDVFDIIFTITLDGNPERAVGNPDAMRLLVDMACTVRICAARPRARPRGRATRMPAPSPEAWRPSLEAPRAAAAPWGGPLGAAARVCFALGPALAAPPPPPPVPAPPPSRWRPAP